MSRSSPKRTLLSRLLRRLGTPPPPPRRHDAGTEFMATVVDLARPPIVGLVEPEWELRRLTTEMAELDKLTEVS